MNLLFNKVVSLLNQTANDRAAYLEEEFGESGSFST